MPKQYEHLSLSVGRDYRTTTKYEFVVFGRNGDEEDGEVVVRAGCFKTAAAARRAGIKAAKPLQAPSLF